MAAKRCTNCAINYPVHIRFCRVCKLELWMCSECEPTEGWEEETKAKLKVAAETTDPGRPMPLEFDRVATYNGQSWIHDNSLFDAGYRNVDVGDVISVLGATGAVIYLEIAARARQDGRALPGWWVVRMDDTLQEWNWPVLGDPAT